MPKTKEQKKIEKLKKELEIYKLMGLTYVMLYGALNFKDYDIVRIVEIANRLKPYRDKIIEEYEKGKR